MRTPDIAENERERRERAACPNEAAGVLDEGAKSENDKDFFLQSVG